MEPLVDIGDRIKISLKPSDIVNYDFDTSNLSINEQTKLIAIVTKIKKCNQEKFQSIYKYTLKIIDSNVEVKTRLACLSWKPIKRKVASLSLTSSSSSSQLPVHKYILAPMVGASELPFRLLCRKYGAQLAYTPMMNSERFAVDSEYRKQEFQTTPSDRPLVAHFSGNDPQVLFAAAKHIENSADAIDLNLGCPQRIAHAGHFGSYLLDEEDRPLVINIVKTLSSNLKIPVFVKIRLLSTLKDTIKLCFQLAAAGSALIAIHARHRVNLVGREGAGARDGAALLDQVKAIKEAFLKNNEYKHVIIISNGNVVTYKDVEDNLKLTRADGVMSAEGLLDDPALFFPTLDSTHNSDLSTTHTNKKHKSSSSSSASGTTTSTSSSSSHITVKPTPIELAIEYLDLVNTYPTALKTVIFHIRRMLKDLLLQYDLLETLVNAVDMGEVRTTVLTVQRYEASGGFLEDQDRLRRAKEAAERRKIQESKRKEYEKRIVRKAKREGKDLSFYLELGAQMPSVQELQAYRTMSKEESFGIWKAKHSQHCYSYHLYQHEGGRRCDRDRTCAFLHIDPTYDHSEKEVFG